MLQRGGDQMKQMMITITALALTAAASNAETLKPVTSSIKDQQVCGNGELVWAGQTTARIGFDTVVRMGDAYIAVFKLPALPAGEIIKSASLSVNITVPQSVHPGDLDWNVDVYGVRSSDTEAVLASDFFDGADDVKATKVIDNFVAIKGAAPATAGICDSGKSETFGAWLQTLYADGAPKQKYAVVRLNPDVAFGDFKKGGQYQLSSKFLQIGTGDHADVKPAMTITTGAK
jgi:hypothetical protein